MSLASVEVREAREDILRMVTEELSKPSFDRELPFFEGELKQSGSKAEWLAAKLDFDF